MLLCFVGHLYLSNCIFCIVTILTFEFSFLIKSCDGIISYSPEITIATVRCIHLCFLFKNDTVTP